MIYSSLGPDFPSVPVDDALNDSQSYSRPFKLFAQVQTLKDAEQLVHVLHVKARAIVPEEYPSFVLIPVHAANLDLGLRVRMLVNLTALETRLTTTSLSMERSP